MGLNFENLYGSNTFGYTALYDTTYPKIRQSSTVALLSGDRMGGCWRGAADNNVARIEAGIAVYKGVTSSLLKESSVQSRKISEKYTLLLLPTCGLPARS
jgi:hypothetical protein